MRVDTIEIGSETVQARRAELYEKGSLSNGGRSWELRASGVSDVPRHVQWPAVVVRCNGDVYHGRVFVDRRDSEVRLYGLLGQV